MPWLMYLPKGPLPCPSFAQWPQSLHLVPALLPPDFPSWTVSPVGPMPNPGPAPWHSAQLGTCSWNPATLPLCSSREQGVGPGPGGPRVRPKNGDWSLVHPQPGEGEAHFFPVLNNWLPVSEGPEKVGRP